MAQNPKYDNDMVNLGYLNKRLGQTEESINNNNSAITRIPKNYSTPPNPPYYKDSLLCYGNKIYRCNTTKLQGIFSWNDWTIVATDDTTISDFIKNTYEVEKLEIQEQIDGKVQTYYQETNPSTEWTTDLEKAKHIGDYWYNTTNNTQWRYNQITTTSPITYGWGQVNIPNAVFDLIDKKKSIYTEKPTSYKKDDLWIVEETISDDDLPTGTEENPIAKGDWVFAIEDSEIYNKEHWIKRDENVDITYLEKHYYNTETLDTKFTVLENNIDSKITQSKDEIELQVSQSYTTKEETEKIIYDYDEQIGIINDTLTTYGENISELSVENGRISANVTNIETIVNETSVNLNNNYQELNNKFEDYVPESTFVTLENSVTQLQTDTYTKTEINTKLTDGSVTKVKTVSGTFDEDGMHYEKSNAPTSSTINERGVEVDSTTTGEELLFAGYDEELKQTIVRTENLTVRKYFVIGENSRIEDYGNGSGIFTL